MQYKHFLVLDTTTDGGGDKYIKGIYSDAPDSVDGTGANVVYDSGNADHILLSTSNRVDGATQLIERYPRYEMYVSNYSEDKKYVWNGTAVAEDSLSLADEKTKRKAYIVDCYKQDTAWIIQYKVEATLKVDSTENTSSDDTFLSDIETYFGEAYAHCKAQDAAIGSAGTKAAVNGIDWDPTYTKDKDTILGT